MMMPAPMPGADRDQDHVLRILPHAEPQFPQGSQVDVVIHGDRQLVALVQAVP